MGTPQYMAPEQILGRRIDGRADLYGLACVALWLLTAEAPFAEATALATLVAHVSQPPPALSRLAGSGIPPELEDVLTQCLEKAPDQRPPDARAVAERLRAIELPPDQAWTEERARAWWADRGSEPPRVQLEQPHESRMLLVR